MSRGDEQLRPWETGSLTYEGQVEAIGLFAHGLRTNRRGRRRAAVASAVLVLVLAIAVVIAVFASTSGLTGLELLGIAAVAVLGWTLLRPRSRS